jgi:hypothetical protein
LVPLAPKPLGPAVNGPGIYLVYVGVERMRLESGAVRCEVITSPRLIVWLRWRGCE